MPQSNKTEIVTEQRVSPVVPMSIRELMLIMGTGLAIGAVVAVMWYVLERFVFGEVLCRPQNSAECGNASSYAMIVAMVIGLIIGTITLAKMRVYRPLFVILTTAITLWGVDTLVKPLPFWLYLVILSVLFAAVFGLFSWVSRLRSFIGAIVVAAVAVVIIRLVLNA